MTDLTYCYLHMTDLDIDVLDTIGTSEYFTGELPDEDMDMPGYMVPPNPEDSDALPSQVHPSYPFGNPTDIKHPASRPRIPFDPSSRALFEDMGFGGGGINGSIRWKELALDLLLPVDEEKEQAEKAAEARRMATGMTTNHHPGAQPPGPPAQVEADMTSDEEDEDEDDEDDSEDDSEED